MLRLVPATPGSTVPKEAFWASLIAACVKFHVIGKEKVAPCARALLGSVALLHWKFLLPVVQPLMDEMAMRAVQLMILVAVLPIETSPKSTGVEQLRGRATGDPRQMTFPFVSEV